MSSNYFRKQKKHSFKKIRNPLIFLLLLLIVVCALLIHFLFGSRELASSQRLTIPQGYSVIQTGNLLQEKGLIRSALAFRALARYQNSSVKAGTYLFDQGSFSLFEVLNRIHRADYGDVYIKVTIPEGVSLSQMADILGSNITGFDRAQFMQLTAGKEGYLFPDSYQFLPEADTKTIVDTLIQNFSDRTASLQEKNTKRDWSDIVIMASLIEKEAGQDSHEQKMVAGILWKRLDRGMLLQVDAPFVYVSGKGSAELRLSDLRSDHPYNTYTRKGLTPTPIGNPGLSSLEAAVSPVDSPYLFYLHGKDGVIRYGVTHNDHVNNKNRYLR